MALTATDISRFSGCGMTSASVAASVDEEYRPKRVVQRVFLFWRHGCSADRNSPAGKGKSLRCLRKCRFPYIDTSRALSARRHLTAAPRRPSRLRLGCQTHQTYCFQTSSEPPRLPSVACCAHHVQSFDLDQKFWCLGFNEQIFGADEQNPGRGQSD
jgi:hypothetical protein